VQANLPPELKGWGSADVVLTIDVDETGKVTKVAVLQSAGEAFDEAAVAAAQQFQFEPGEYQEKPVPVRITYRYRFLENPPPAPAPEHPAAPSVPLGGVVLRKGDRVPLEGITVAVDDGTLSTQTDANGRFELDAVPIGKHTVHLRGPGIAPADGAVELNAGKRLDLRYYVAAKERYASTVRAQPVVQEAIEQTLQAEEFRRIPGTQGDTLKAIQNLPGVARAPFGGGLLAVWGSAPQDTRTYVDGVFIPTLYHFGGLRSTFNGEMVRSLSFLPGGYGVEFGRGLGGVIEIESRRPRTDSWHGFAQVDLIDGSFLIDGPITKELSLSFSARRSWIDIFLPLFTTSDFQLSPKYWDYQADLHWRASPRDDLDLLFFGSDDRLNLIIRNPDPTTSPSVDSHIFYHRGLLRWLHRFGGGATFQTSASLGYDVPFQFQVNAVNASRLVDLKTFEYSLRAVAHLPVLEWLRIDAGLDYEGNTWPISATLGPTGPPREGDPGGFGTGGGRTGLVSETATFYQNKGALFLATALSLLDKRLTITPQVRFEVLSSSAYHGTPQSFVSNSLQVEPRLTARFKVLPWLAPKMAVGLYHQPPLPYDYSRAFGNPDVNPELGIHYVAGADLDPIPWLHIEAEGFYKDLRHLIVRGENPGDPLLVNDGVGRVYGAELLVKKELAQNFFGWLSYTYSRSRRRDHPDTTWRLFQFDQTHILTLVGSYIFGNGYQLGMRFRYVTGNPYTPVTRAYYQSALGRYQPIFGPVYSGRLGSFNQLDIRFDKTWTYDKWKLSLYLDIQNVYNRSNPEGVQYNFDFTQKQPQAGLPFLPVFGLRGEL
jgi:TonB family protein